jgi:hypothetical protein
VASVFLVADKNPLCLEGDDNREACAIGQDERFLNSTHLSLVIDKHGSYDGCADQLPRFVELHCESTRAVGIHRQCSSKRLIGKVAADASRLRPGDIPAASIVALPTAAIGTAPSGEGLFR